VSSELHSSTITGTDTKGKIHALVGYKPMKAAAGAAVYRASERIQKASLPKKVDMRPMLTPVEDQGDTSSCVANAVAGAYEYWIKRLHNKDYDISRLYVYYNARWRDGDPTKDDGTYIQTAMESLGDYGACSEATWPFQKKLLKQKPNRNAYKEGANFKVKTRQQIPVELEAWKHCLAEGKPIVFGCVLFDSFDECTNRGGVVPMPDPKEVHRKTHGGHSMLCVGYSDVDEVFIVRNSWGEDWGDKGYCYMPYNYLMNPKFNDADCWAFVPDEELPLLEDTWKHDDKPVVNDGKGVDFEINPYTIASYSAVALSYFEKVVPKEYTGLVHEAYTLLTDFIKNSNWDEVHDFDHKEIASQEGDEASNAASEGEEDSEDEDSEDEDSEDEDSEDEDSEDEDSEDEDSEDEDSEDEDSEDEDSEDEDSEDEDSEDEDSEDEDSEDEDSAPKKKHSKK
jgi:C1A family cysteine protease